VAGIRPLSVNPLRLYMRTRPRNGFTSSYTTRTIHATESRAKLSTKKSIAVDQSRVESSRERGQKSSQSGIVLDRSCSSTQSISGLVTGC